MTSLSQLTSDLRDFRPDQDYLYVGMNDQIAVWKKGRGLDSFYRHLCSFFWSFEKRDVINKLNEQLAGKTIERDVQIAENLRVLLDTRFTKNNKISRRDYYTMQHCITAFNRLERSYPPIGRYDTIRSDKNGNIVSAHGKPNCFADHEIVEIHPIVRETTCDGIPVKFSERNKAIIQQQATRGCTTAATAMLIHDAGKSFNGQLLSRTNLGNDTSMCREITSAGLQPRVHKNIELENLDQLLQEHGSAIVSIFDQMGVAGHVVVVDEITESGIRLRDPYHGWEITVSHDAFKRCYQKCDSIITVSHSPE